MSEEELESKAKPEEMMTDEERASLEEYFEEPPKGWPEDIVNEKLPLETPVEQMIHLRQPIPKEKLQSEDEFSNPARFFENFDVYFNNPNYLEKMKNRLKGQTIVDLGAGVTNLGYEAAAKLEAAGYIAVEPYHAEQLRHGGNFAISNLIYDPKDSDLARDQLIPWAVVETDMLSFLKSVDDNQISIMLCGIDTDIIEDGNYREEVRNEIERTLSPDGGVLSMASDIYYPTVIRDGIQVSDRDHDEKRTIDVTGGRDIKLYIK